MDVGYAGDADEAIPEDIAPLPRQVGVEVHVPPVTALTEAGDICAERIVVV